MPKGEYSKVVAAFSKSINLCKSSEVLPIHSRAEGYNHYNHSIFAFR